MDMLIKSIINCSTLYRRDPHLTFLAKYQDRSCILKLIYDRVDINNEAVVTSMLHRYDPQSYPRVVFLDRSNPWNLTLGSDTYRIIESLCIEALPDMPLGAITRIDKRQLQVQLDELHRLGIIHGDVQRNNIIRRPNGDVFLIDYGYSYSSGDPLLPPTINSMSDDNSALAAI